MKISFNGVGRLQNDPELKYIGEGNAVCKFTLKNSKKIKGESVVSFFDCEVWGRSAEILAEYKKKDDIIQVGGYLWQETWESSGQKRSKVILKVESVDFIDQGLGEKKSTPPKSAAKPQPPEDDFPGVPF